MVAVSEIGRSPLRAYKSDARAAAPQAQTPMKDGRTAPMRLTSEEYWESSWRRRRTPTPPRASWYPDRRFIELFGSLGDRNRSKVLEVGAGGTRWLPHLGLTWGAEVWGLDYSPRGCAVARDALAGAGVRGTILERDLFDRNDDLLERFDLVSSLGLVEHFDDASVAVGAISRYVRPGGL